MVWKKEHKEKSRACREELVKLPKCVLTDWVGKASATACFKNAWCFDCSCGHCNHTFACHWCGLYAKNHESIDGKVLDIKLMRKRNELSCYDDEGYDRFVRKYLPIFADTHQYTLSFVVLPMLVWVKPGEMQFGHTLFRREDASFVDVQMDYHALVLRCIERSATTHMTNPRLLSEDHFEDVRRQQVFDRIEKKFFSDKKE